ncbi:MaoC/PaaZ C-terminal domain-containing protein [Microbacterium sp. RD1]|uniref:MaoC/PaaZ C-terminal domain-containing protein n=1 Tax=Microbacterium sp. RD1 TaxID=3457313 RepID=UPI003FA5FD00
MTEPRLTRAEDLVVGERIEIGSHTPSLEEIVTFARQWDPQAFHVDEEAAAAGFFGGIIGSGVHSLAILQRLAVTNLLSTWDVIAGRAIRDIELTSPLRPDVTVFGTVTVVAVALRDDSRALVTTRGELRNAGGRAILTKTADSYVRRRAAQ